METIYRAIDTLNDRAGRATSWLALLLVVLVTIDVVLRYLFNYTQNWILELEWHLFAMLFLLSAGFALLHDKHVRVDVFYARWSIRQKAWVDLIGHLLLLLPWSYVIIRTGTRYMLNSWYIREGSDQPGGLPARYVIKGIIVVGFILLLLQGVSEILKKIIVLRQEAKTTTEPASTVRD